MARSSALVLFALTTAAYADGRADASKQFSDAEARFSRGDYLGAAEHFEAAAKLVSFATTWLNAAEARELGGDLAHAAEDAERSLADPTATRESTAEAKARLARLAPKIGTIEILSTAGAIVALDGEGVGVATPVTRRVKPGSHVIVRTDRGTPQPSVHVDVAAGASQTVDADVEFKIQEVVVTKEVPAQPELPQSHHQAAWVAFGTAGALAIATGVVGGLTLRARTSYDDMPTQTTLDAFHRERFFTNIGVGATLVAIAAGAYLRFAF